MQRIERSAANVTTFGAHLEPRITVDAGEPFVIHTQDNAAGTIAGFEDLPDREHPALRTRQYPSFNPLGGPVHVRGAAPGDALEVTIEGIEVVGDGWTGIVEGRGWLAETRGYESCAGPFTAILPSDPGPSGSLADGETGAFGRRWPLQPFIGTLATAPERGAENTLISQGPWGGNLDVREFRAGARVRLNVGVEGARLFVGDVHGSQGDGELTGLANEVAADVRLSCEVLPGRRVPGVARVETDDALVQIDTARNAGDMKAAMWSCYRGMIDWLRDEHGMDPREAYVLLSVHPGVEARVYQFTPALATCGVKVPRSLVEGGA